MIPGPFKTVSTKTTTASSNTKFFTFSSSELSAVPAGSKHLVILFSCKPVSGVNDNSQHLSMTFNGDKNGQAGSGDYNYAYLVEHMTGESGSATCSGGGAGTGITLGNMGLTVADYNFSTGIIIIPHYSNTANHKTGLCYFGRLNTRLRVTTWRYISTAAITQLTFGIPDGSFANGTFEAGSTVTLAVMDEDYNVGTADISSTGTATFSGISGSNEDLVMIGYGRGNGSYTADSLYMDINGDSSAANRQAERLSGTFVTLSGEFGNANRVGTTLGNSSQANAFAPFALVIQQYADSGSTYPHIMAFSGQHYDGSTVQGSVNATIEVDSVVWKNTSAITTLQPYSGSSSGKQWIAGSYISLYKLPRNRILNHDLGSPALVLGGSLSSTDNDAIAGSYYAASNAPNNDNPRYEVNDDSSNHSRQGLQASAGSVSAFSDSENNIGQTSTAGYGAQVYTGGPLVIVQPHKTDRYKNTLVASGIPYYSVHGNTPVLWLISNRWANTASITKIELNGYYGDQWKSGSQIQIEGVETAPVTLATSGFFFRFMSIAAPTVGLAAASSYLSWLTSVSA